MSDDSAAGPNGVGGGWSQLAHELKSSCPGLMLHLQRILAEADARHLAVVTTPTGEYGSSRGQLVRALSRAGFAPSPDDPTGHTMRRPPRPGGTR